MKNHLFLLIVSSFLIVGSISISNCKKGYEDRFGPFYVANDTLVYMNGDMGNRIADQFDDLISQYPDISMIIMEECPGSKDDIALFEAGVNLKNHNINIHLPPYGQIESGAVDLFLAGTIRTMEAGAKIGVHSWSEGSKEATDYPPGDQAHEPYIQYYMDIGRTREDAEEFYYFTINSASADNIHWMTKDEIAYYMMTTN